MGHIITSSGRHGTRGPAYRPRMPQLPDTRAKRIGVIAFILSPLAVLALLCWWMYFALRNPPAMEARPIGAGAGHTGMSNEYVGLGKGRPEGTQKQAAPGQR
jgi:hypothetical protein